MMSKAMVTESSFPSELQDSISCHIQSGVERCESLRRENAFLENEIALAGEEIRVFENEELQLKMSLQALQSTQEALQLDIEQVIHSRRESEAELRALKKEVNKLSIKEEDSELMSAGQECFESFLKHLKRSKTLDKNNNQDKDIESPLEKDLNREREDLEGSIRQLELRAESLREDIAQRQKSLLLPLASPHQQKERLNKLGRDKFELASQVTRLEKEYETLKLRTGKRGFFMK